MAIPRECKRLAEVDFPISAVGRHSLAEKGRRMGTPHQVHLWWAWRPLAACRAMLLALLLPDPCDERCPDEFKRVAREAARKVQKVGPTDQDLRAALLKFIGDFANWDLAANPRYLEAGRSLVRAAHPEEPPLVVDSFAGGGSIPLEALRLGCEAFASDLNPVACLILKVLLQDIPRHGPELADELRRVGKEIKEATERELAVFYPPDPDGARPIAYLWARTVHCEQPNCGAQIPLVRSMWLSKKAMRPRALAITNRGQRGRNPEFAIVQPESEADVQRGTVNRARATCPACNIVLEPERVRAQLSEQRGGADVVFDDVGQRVGGARMLAVVTLREGEQGRRYRLPTSRDYEAVWKAMRRLEEAAATPVAKGLNAIPDEPLPPIGTLGFRVQRYGMLQWGDLFTARQKLSLLTLARNVAHSDDTLAQELLALSLSKLAERNNSICDWMVDVECPGHLFTQQVLPPAWDFAEAVPVCESSGSFLLAVDNTATNACSSYGGSSRTAGVHVLDACELTLPDESCQVFFTDPPYYDQIPYADLSDFFFVWLKRALVGHQLLRDPYDAGNVLTPKEREAIQDEARTSRGRPKDKAFFEAAMEQAFGTGNRILSSDGVACVVFAHQTTEGWEALLSGMMSSRWVITASWPIATERSSRTRARDSAALEASIHLVCRPRPENAKVGDWADVLRELPGRVDAWMKRLQAEGIRGADLVFACIGPALEIYSRYSRVVDAEDREIPLGGDPEAADPYQRGYLAYVWETVGRAALQQVLGQDEGAGTLEEDARLVALFLWTLQSTNGASGGAKDNEESDDVDEDLTTDEDEEEGSAGRKPKGYTLIFDVARRFAQPLGIHLDDWEGRIIETKKGIVRLLPVAERAKQLFGEDGAQAAADRIEKEPASAQLSFFPEMQAESKPRRGRRKVTITASDESISQNRDATTLDRLHIAMLLQSSGRANALRALLAAEQQRGPEFLRLANALSALYPRESEEKRLLDAMLLAVPN